MPKRLVLPGECIASLAATCGVTPEQLWNDPDNAPLRERRGDPSMLMAGDEVALPEPTREGASVSAGGSHSFVGQRPTVRLVLKLHDEVWPDETVQGSHETSEQGTRSSEPELVDPPPLEPLASVPYRLSVAGRVIEGTTDGDGLLDETVDARATVAELVLDPDTEDERRLELHIGVLDPADEPSGITQRLSNLGFTSASPDHAPMTIAHYQESRGLEINGELDDATRGKIVDESGC